MRFAGRGGVVRAVAFGWMLLVLPLAAVASHYRGGTITGRVDAAGVLVVEMQTLWRDTFIDVPYLELWNESRTVRLAQTTSFLLVADQIVNPAGRDLIGYYARRTQTWTISLAALGLPSGTYRVRYDDCCRVGEVHNVAQEPFVLETTIVYAAGAGNGAPTMIPATVDIVARGRNYVQSLLSQDPDRGPVRYDFLVGAEAPDWGPSTSIPGISVDADGIVRIPAANSAAAALGRWVYKARVTDTSGAAAERDILLAFQDPTPGNTAPVLGAIGSILGPYPVGTPITIPLSGTDVDTDGQTVTTRSGPLPFGATAPQATVPAPGTASTGFSWVPAPGDEGIYRLYFETHDGKPSDLLFTPYIDTQIVQVTVADHFPPTLGALANRCVLPGTAISIPVSATDPDGTLVTLSASFLPAGAAFPTVSANGAVTGTFSWTPTAADLGMHNVVFTAIDAGTPPLSLNTGLTVSVVSSLPATNLFPATVACTVPTELTVQLGNGISPYTIDWQARSAPGGEWVTFETDSVLGGSAASAKATVHPAGVGFPQTSTSSYRALVRDSANCQVVTTEVTVSGGTAPPTITVHPQPASICAGQTATFSVAANADTFRWERSTDGGATWVSVAGASTATWTTPPQYQDSLYRAVVSSGCSPLVPSAVARLTITPLPASPANSLRVTKVTPTHLLFDWAPCAASTSYALDRCAPSLSAPCVPAAWISTPEDLAEDGAAVPPDLWYRVKSVGVCGEAE